jgi:glycosyltransferase involved in cell wall biosynthesis
VSDTLTNCSIARKILLVANTDWYLYNFRRGLASFLQDRGMEVVLVSPPGRFAPLLQQAGFRWIQWQVDRRSIAPWKEITSLIALQRIYRQEKPDLVHHHTIKPVLYGSLAARSAGVPMVVNSITGRGYVFMANDLRSRLLRKIVLRLYSWALKLPRVALICENQSDRDYFISSGLCAKENAWLIEGVGVSADHFTAQPEAEGTPIVLFAGRLLWDKGLGVLVEAARLLRGTVPVRVVLAGAPDPGNPSSVDQSALRSWEQEGLVEWQGFSRDMRRTYAQSHIVCLPTFSEGLPTVLLEAAASARPIIASDIPGCRHVVEQGKNGLLVPPKDARALAESIARLARDPLLRKKMGACGREKILQKFTVKRVNEATWDVYQILAWQAGRNLIDIDGKRKRAA